MASEKSNVIRTVMAIAIVAAVLGLAAWGKSKLVVIAAGLVLAAWGKSKLMVIAAGLVLAVWTMSKLFGGDSRKRKTTDATPDTVKTIAAAAGLGLAAWGMSKLVVFAAGLVLAAWGKSKLMVIAPGLVLAVWTMSKLFERASRKRKTMDATAGTVIAVAAVAGLGLAAGWGMSKLLESAPEDSDNRKKMKAPGRDYKIYRDDFERDPASYFRKLRK